MVSMLNDKQSPAKKPNELLSCATARERTLGITLHMSHAMYLPDGITRKDAVIVGTTFGRLQKARLMQKP